MPLLAGGTVAQVALAWLLRKPAVASVVIGATTPAQLEDNIKAACLELSEEQVIFTNGQINGQYYSELIIIFCRSVCWMRKAKSHCHIPMSWFSGFKDIGNKQQTGFRGYSG